MLSTSNGLSIIRRFKISKCFKSSSACRPCEEVRIPVPWGHVAGKWWGPTDKRPILTLHGWQDNCGSFNRLIPLLPDNVGYLAIDFPGHGHSSRIPSGLYNYFINYVILVRYIVDYFGWSKVSFLGHSLGAITSYIYTTMYPKDVDLLMCIDALKPMITPNNVQRMAEKIDAFLKLDRYERSTKEPPSYTLDEILKRVCLPNDNSVDYEHAFHIAERNIAPSKITPGQYYFSRDPRIKVPELMNFPQQDILDAAVRMTGPIFMAKAKSASYYEVKANFYDVLDVLKKSSIDCVYERLDGKHHLHLNNPEILAEHLKLFMEKHDIEDRSIGGIKDEMKKLDCDSRLN